MAWQREAWHGVGIEQMRPARIWKRGAVIETYRREWSILKEMRIVLIGDPATKKNNARIVSANGKDGSGYSKLLPSTAFVRYEADCLKQITGNYRYGIDWPVNVKAVYYMRTRRTVDLSNLLEATHDILVKANVLRDDNRNVIASTDGSRVYWDKRNPRVEITITDAEPDYTQWDTQK